MKKICANVVDVKTIVEMLEEKYKELFGESVQATPFYDNGKFFVIMSYIKEVEVKE